MTDFGAARNVAKTVSEVSKVNSSVSIAVCSGAIAFPSSSDRLGGFDFKGPSGLADFGAAKKVSRAVSEVSKENFQ